MFSLFIIHMNINPNIYRPRDIIVHTTDGDTYVFYGKMKYNGDYWESESSILRRIEGEGTDEK